MKDDVFQMNREFFYKIAQENTRKNRYGQTTISRTDEDFYDDDWEEAYRKSQQSMNEWYERKDDSGKDTMYQLSVALPAVEEKEKAEIIEMVKSFIKEINPLKIILFGSFATGEYNTASDYDFYIVVEDDFEGQQITLAAKAHKSIRQIKTRPVDIIVETGSRFNSFADKASCIEHELSRSGVILCERMFLVMDEISTPLSEQEDHPLLHDPNIKEFLERLFEEYDLKRKD